MVNMWIHTNHAKLLKIVQIIRIILENWDFIYLSTIRNQYYPSKIQHWIQVIGMIPFIPDSLHSIISYKSQVIQINKYIKKYTRPSVDLLTLSLFPEILRFLITTKILITYIRTNAMNYFQKHHTSYQPNTSHN